MKNLKLLYSSAVKNELIEDASTFCVNSDTGAIYFTTGKLLHCLESETTEITSISLNLDLTDDEVQIIQMQYLLETQSLCLVFYKGDIVVYNILDQKEECVGCVDFGLRAAAWSPDQELFVVLTGADTFILMTKDFYPLLEKTVHAEEFGESCPITVGWGSKETQFHGSEGKGAAKVKLVEPKQVLPWDDGKPRINWRGDSDFFVTSVVDSKQGCRKLRIWNREGILQYTSEVKDGLEHSLCWSPSGSLIACTQQHPNKHEVIFFEKNGLQHGQFTLPFPPKSFLVKEILWNTDSSIFLIWGHEMDNTSKFSVLLWTVNNYHWYLKQTLSFDYNSTFFIKQVSWDAQHPYRLHIFCSGGQYFQYTWAFTVFHSLGVIDNDHVSTIVIDNDSALVTPFKKIIVPPPMCSYSISCPANINNAVFAPYPNTENFCLILSNKELAFFSKVAPSVSIPLPNKYKITLQAAGGNGFKSRINPHFYSGSYSIDWSRASFLLQYPLSLCHWIWTAEKKLLCVGSDGSLSSSVILSVELPSSTGSSDAIVLKGDFCARTDKKVIGICLNEDGTVAAVQLVSGNILMYKHDQLSPWLCHGHNLCLPVPCPQFSLHTVNNQVLVLALSDRFSLYCNDSTLISKCTSYCCNGDFLLITTCDNNLKCYSMSAVLEIANGNSQVSLSELSSQQCERGARILTSVPGDTKLILQIPRGNLEVIHPRPLVVSTICKFLNNNQYKKAFDTAKIHRINLNILYDYNPQKFLSSVDIFVEEIDSPTDLNIFLVSLLNENVSKTLYSFQNVFECSDEISFSSKCDLVCDAVRKVVETKNVERYFETLIATYSQKTNPELDKALFKIKEMKGAVKEQNNFSAIADKALKFLLFLVDVDKLYKVALGTYDFELAVMVAEKSNMDPKEYLPFLNSLQEMEDNYRKYKIDTHLQRYKNALQNISKCGDRFEECLALIKSQRLYAAALYLFPDSSDHFKAIWNEYGNYLMGKMYYKEAGLAYWKCQNWEKSLKAYQESGDWEDVLCAAHHLEYSQDRKVLLCHNLAMKLKEQQRYKESALLLELYCEKIEQSILIMIEGHLWDSILYSIYKHNRFDLVTTHLIPALVEHYQYLLTSLCQMEVDFCRYSDRLKIVREKKDCCTSDIKHDGLSDTTEDDLFSETSSVGSAPSSQISKQFSGSLVTRKSSRSKRKLELKKYRLKEGSADEDLALITHLSNIITRVDKMRDNFFSFLKILVHYNLEDKAKEIQQKMKHIVAMIEINIPKIWVTVKPSMDMNFGPGFTTNAIVDVIEAQKKVIRNLSDPALMPPKWISKDIYLHLLDEC